MAALARPERRPGDGQVGVFAALDGAYDREIRPRLSAAPLFCLADTACVAGVVGCADEISDHVLGQRYARHHRSVLGERRDAFASRLSYGCGPGLGVEVGVRLDPTEAGPECPEVNESVVAV